jgi:hypothetical protein
VARLQIVHFTQGACDALRTHDAKGVRFLPLADGHGDTHLSCVHLNPGATINRNINISAGIGAVFDPREPYTFKSDPGAILLIVEAEQLSAHERGISTPERIAGQTWPSDAVLCHAP